MNKRLLTIIAVAAIAVISVTVLMAAVFGPRNSIDMNFMSALSEAQEVPDNGSMLRGTISVKFNRRFSWMKFELKVSNITEKIVAAHLHCARAGENGNVVVSLYSGSFIGASGVLAAGMKVNSDVVTVAGGTCGQVVNNIASLAAALMDDRIYVNVHTTLNPPGEVRGQLFGH